jgi:hypothetical protein
VFLGFSYETQEDADFSTVNILSSSLVSVSQRDPKTNQPINYNIELQNIPVIAGQTKTTTVNVGSYEAFYSINLPDNDVIEVLNITDSEGNIWYEVDFLAQDTVFDVQPNTGQDASEVPYVLILRAVPFRFITEFDFSTGITSITFGSGDAQSFDGDLIPDLGDLSLPTFGKSTFTDFTLNPQNFLRTSTLGLTPVNTTLTISYRVGGGILTNAGVGQVNTIGDKTFEIGDSTLNTSTVRDVGNSFSVTNSQAIQGGNDEIDVDTLKQLIPAIYASQSRVVTAPDYIARTLSMPAKFGSVFRGNVQLNPLNQNSLELIVLSIDQNGYLTVAPPTLKQNLQTYLSRFRMMSDAIELLDGQIINLGFNFGVLTNPDYNKNEVLSNCITQLIDFFDTNNFSMNQPINISDIYVVIKDVPGVVSITNLNFVNLTGISNGRQYSTTPFNVAANTNNGLIYCNSNSMFEIKYKNVDIKGVAK